MEKIRTRKILQAASCLLCVIVGWAHLDDVGASEFIGGWLTGPLFEIADYGIVFFLVDLLLIFFYRRLASIMAILASILCMPFYLYFLAPGPFRRVFRGEYSVPLRASFVWNTWAVLGILSLIFAIVTSLRCLTAAESASIPKPENSETA
jgi:hypothetical protein